jgi:hypothetical protein
MMEPQESWADPERSPALCRCSTITLHVDARPVKLYYAHHNSGPDASLGRVGVSGNGVSVNF